MMHIILLRGTNNRHYVQKKCTENFYAEEKQAAVVEKEVVGCAGFEPATNGLKVRCSTD